MQIKIYLDGTFEAVAAKSLSPVEKRAKIKELQTDLKTIKKVEALRVTRDAAKKAGNKVKDKELLAKIKALKATLSSNRNSSTAIVTGFIKAVMDMPTGAAKTIAQIDKESKKPATKKPLSNAAHQKLEDQKEHYQNKIAMHKESLAKVPKGTKYELRRQMLRDNIRDAEDNLDALVKPGKKAATPASAPAPTRKRRIARESEEDAVGRKKRQAIELITDKMAQTRDPAKLAALKAQLLKAQTGPSRAMPTAAERAAEKAARKPLKPRAKSKDEKALDRVHEAENALIKYRENKAHPVHDKIRPGDKVAKAEMREMEQLMADLPEAKTNYRKMPKSAVMQKSRDTAKKMIDAMEKRLDMLKKKYIGQAKK